MNLDNEKELEDYLVDDCHELGGKKYFHDSITGEMFADEVRQLKIGAYGIADIVRLNYHDQRNTFQVQITELKKGILNKDGLFQICRYKRGLERYVSALKKHKGISFEVEFFGVLCGSGIELSTDFVYAAEQVDWLELYTFSICIEHGISFDFQKGFKIGRSDEEEAFTSEIEELLMPLCIENKNFEEASKHKPKSDCLS